MGRLGKAAPGTQAPARASLESIGAEIDELRARGELGPPPGGARKVWNYICYYVDTSTNERLSGGVAWTIETDLSGTYQRAAAAARRLTLQPNPQALSPPPPTGPNVKLRCRRVGDIYILPPQ